LDRSPAVPHGHTGGPERFTVDRLWLKVEHRLAACRVEGNREMFVGDQPSAIDPAAADGYPHPTAPFLAVRSRSAAPAEIVAEGNIVARGNGQLVNLEHHRAGAHRHAHLPMRSVGIAPL